MGIMTKSELIEKLSDGHELLNKKEAENGSLI